MAIPAVQETIQRQYINQGFNSVISLDNKVYIATKNGLLAVNPDVLQIAINLELIISLNNPIDYYESLEFDDVYRLTGRIFNADENKALNLFNAVKLVYRLDAFMGGDEFYLKMRERLGTPKLPFMFTGSVYRFGEKNNDSPIQVIKRFCRFDKERKAYLDEEGEEIKEGHRYFAEITGEQARLLRLREREYRFIAQYDKNGIPLELTGFPKNKFYDRLSTVPTGDRAVVRGFDRGLGKPTLCISFPLEISDPTIGIFAARELT